MALIKDKILVIEDEKSISYLLGTVLTANGYDVIKAYTGTEACAVSYTHLTLPTNREV